MTIFSKEGAIGKLFRHKQKLNTRILPTAEDILNEPQKYPTGTVRTARVTTNLADFLSTKILGEPPKLPDNSQVTIALNEKGEAAHHLDFTKGGNFTFDYKDEKNNETFKGVITIGIRRGYKSSLISDKEHPFIGFELGTENTSFYFHFVDKKWELVYTPHGDIMYFPDGRETEIVEYGELIIASASPLYDFLRKIGTPKWQEASATSLTIKQD